MNRSVAVRPWLVLVVGGACAAGFLILARPTVPWGPVIGTGQDEWYNVIRSLRALYEYLHPSYFIHPALYYELLATLYAIERAWLWLSGSLNAAGGFLEYFLAHQAELLDLARCVSLACGALTVIAAVWLSSLLSTVGGGLLAGVVVASLPLLRGLATSIRVDALALATYVAAAALLVRWNRNPNRRSLIVACAGIGVAAAANYPGAMLLLVLAWFEYVRAGADDLTQRVRRVALACAVAFTVFLVLNPYVILDLRLFLRWFLFQAAVPLYRHPHAPEPTVWRYLEVLREQGPAAAVVSAAGVLAMLRPREPAGAFAAFGAMQLAGFSLMSTQYDRFVLPAITLLCIAGAAWVCSAAARWIGPRTGVALALAASGLVVWSSAMRFLAQPARDIEPDYRAEMFAWIAANVPPSATLLLESDTMPLLQTVYDPVDRGRRFQDLLKYAFEHAHPQLIKNVVKAQFIAAVYNYDPKLLDTGQVFFLASSQNREFIDANRDLLPEPVAFYAALDTRATVVHETGGFHEKLLMYAVRQ